MVVTDSRLNGSFWLFQIGPNFRTELEFIVMSFIIIIITIYFQARVDCLPQDEQPTLGDTLQELTGPLLDQSPSGSCPSMVLEQVLGDQMSFLGNHVGGR